MICTACFPKRGGVRIGCLVYQAAVFTGTLVSSLLWIRSTGRGETACTAFTGLASSGLISARGDEAKPILEREKIYVIGLIQTAL